MNFLILGCNGMAGHTITLYLKENGYNVVGFAHSKSPFVKTIIGDAHDTEHIKTEILNGNYDIIVNAIGILNKACDENHSDAIFINSYLPHYLASVTDNMNTRIIQLSTDCVFSGSVGKYTENSFPDGVTFYDRTKALGELMDKKNITLRNSIVGPDINKNGIGLLNWFMLQKVEVNGYKNVIWTGMTTLQLARTIEKLSMCDAYGLYNMVPEVSINKYDLLCLFNKYIRKHQIKILPVEIPKVNKSLERTNYKGFKDKIPDYDDQVKDLAQWMKQHKSIYKYYDI
ncbi:MAG: sugar nucleotide-binding protein [Lachnospiraceae bacterium]|nr:sugar nucleotide-binding protein [Lachnospiraceae bacterium]